MIGPFEEQYNVTPFDITSDDSFAQTVLWEEFQQLWNLGFYLSSFEAVLVNDVPIFYDVSKIIPISGVDEMERTSAESKLRSLFSSDFSPIHESLVISLNFQITAVPYYSWQIFPSVSEMPSATVTCKTITKSQLAEDFSLSTIPGIMEIDTGDIVSREKLLQEMEELHASIPAKNNDEIDETVEEAMHSETPTQDTSLKEEVSEAIPSKEDPDSSTESSNGDSNDSHVLGMVDQVESLFQQSVVPSRFLSTRLQPTEESECLPAEPFSLELKERQWDEGHVEGGGAHRGSLVYQGDEDEDVRNAMCEECVKGTLQLLSSLLTVEKENQSVRESGAGKKNEEENPSMEMLPEEIIDTVVDTEKWNIGCGKDLLVCFIY